MTHSASSDDLRGTGGMHPVDLTVEAPGYLADRFCFDEMIGDMKSKDLLLWEVPATQTVVGEHLINAVKDMLTAVYTPTMTEGRLPKYYFDYLLSLEEGHRDYPYYPNMEQLLSRHPVTYRSKPGLTLFVIDVDLDGIVVRALASKWYMYYGIRQPDGSHKYFRNYHLFNRHFRNLKDSRNTGT